VNKRVFNEERSFSASDVGGYRARCKGIHRRSLGYPTASCAYMLHL
jgi:hypothetical protein